ncbi:MAG: S8 family serine peptidase [Chloroflexi bacterium]|nr:S8 family serine peptidase [Chloroflexota bacterium]
MAPEMVVPNGPGNWEGGLLISRTSGISYGAFQSWAEQHGAQVMLYEAGVSYGMFLDGSQQVEFDVTNLATTPGPGIAQILPAGNGAINPQTNNTGRHFQTTVAGAGSVDITFAVPQQSVPTQVIQSVLWRSDQNYLTFKLYAPGDSIGLDLGTGSGGGWYTYQGHDVYRVRSTSGRGTVKFDLHIYKGPVASGSWRLRIASPLVSQEVNGYLWDNTGNYWYGGTEYTDATYVRNTSKTVAFPATADKAIVVGSFIDEAGGIAAYSGRGPRIDGAYIIDITAPGDSITSTDTGNGLNHNYAGYITFTDGYGGTSFSAPHVAGAAALMLQANPALKHDQIEARLKEKATRDGFTGTPPAGDTWGAGKLNVYDAFRREGRFTYGVDASNFAVVRMNYYNANTIPGGIGSYQAKIEYDYQTGEGIQILNVRGVSPFNNPQWNQGGNPIIVGASQQGFQPQPPLNLVEVVPRLVGSSSYGRTITLTVERIIAAQGGANFAPESPVSYTWRRGDARADGRVEMVDALYIAQYRVGIRELGDDTLFQSHC